MKHFDAIIIGTGQAGPPVAARFSTAGKTVAIIERYKFGGTCVNTGCIPTKTMVASAYAAHVARGGAEYAPCTVIQRAMHIHPTVAEYLPTVLSKLEPFA